MSEEIVKFDMNNARYLEYSSDVKEAFRDEYYPDNKVCISETTVTDTINISNSELNGYLRNDNITKYESPSVDYIKTDLENDTINKNLKTEDSEICSADIQNELLFCNHCNEVYQDYCTKCRVLVHILNKRPCHNTYNRVRELPKYMLETRDSIGDMGIFSLKVIPEDVRFGPFAGFNSTVMPLRIKGGRFVVSDNKPENLNWMQYINPARNIYEQNLLPFQYDDKLYYYSTRRIQAGEELLVYFGEEYKDNLHKNIEMDFVPVTKRNVENVFACTLCCLGFRSKEYLAEHKAVHHGETKEVFSVEELTQCPFCKIYLEAKEYIEHHMNYCRETNDRYCALPSPVIHKLEVGKRPFKRLDAKKWKRGIYRCTQCKFRTMYSADFTHHTNKHYEVKMYKYGSCHGRYKTEGSLKAHVEKNHANNKGRGIQKYKSSLEEHNNAKQLKASDYKCVECEYMTNRKSNLQGHIAAKHLKIQDYKCTECEFRTNYKSNVERHVKEKHLKRKDYKCMECEYKTNYKSDLEKHIKAVHMQQKDYKCAECEHMSSRKSDLEKHVKSKHLKQKDYKCMECEFGTNAGRNLEIHIKAKHLRENDYKCIECEYETNVKSNLKVHIKVKHLKQKDHKCPQCEFKTNYKLTLEKHIKTKHLKQTDYKCTECEYKTNYKSDLEKHKKAVHMQQKDYKCEECEHMSSRKSDLEKHIKAKHLKQKDYKCAECEYMSSRKSDLERHIKLKHLKQKDYKCTECEYKTNVKSNLKVHVLVKHLEQKCH